MNYADTLFHIAIAWPFLLIALLVPFNGLLPHLILVGCDRTIRRLLAIDTA